MGFGSLLPANSILQHIYFHSKAYNIDTSSCLKTTTENKHLNLYKRVTDQGYILMTGFLLSIVYEPKIFQQHVVFAVQ